MRPVVRELEAADTYPAAIADKLADAGPLRRDHRARARRARAFRRSPTRAIIERMSAVWMSVPGFINSHLIMAAAVQRYGTETQQRTLAAALRERRAARRHRADRARLRHRPAGDTHARAARRRSLRRQRRQDVDHQQRRGADPRGAGEDRSEGAAAAQGHQPAADREGPGLQGRAQARQARLPRHRHRPSSCSRTAACRPTT